MFGKPVYEIHLMSGGRWVMEALLDTEDDARATASRLMNDFRNSGVRVVRNTGSGKEQVIMERVRSAPPDGGPTYMVHAPKDVAPCSKLEDYYSLESRNTIRQLISEYLDQKVLTPSELLYSHRHLDELMTLGPLVTAAISRISLVRTKQTRQPAQAIQGELNERLLEIRKRAHTALPQARLLLGKAHGVSALVREVAARTEPAHRTHMLMVALCQSLGESRSWIAKIARILDWVAEEQEGAALPYLDGLLADILASPAAIQHLSGRKTSLGQGLCDLYDIAFKGEGHGSVSSSQGNAGRLSRQFQDGRLPLAKAAALRQLEYLLRTAQPLVPNDPDSDRAHFKALLDRLVTADNLLGGPPIAEALTVRYGQRLEKGGMAGLRESIMGVLACMPENLRKIQYLDNLARSAMVSMNADLLHETIRFIVSTDDQNAALFKLTHNPVANLKTLSSLHADIGASTIPNAFRTALTDAAETIQTKSLGDSRLLDRMDTPELSLSKRVMHLAKLCASGFVIPGRPMKLVRDRLNTHMVQPDFVPRFAESVEEETERKSQLHELYGIIEKLDAAVVGPGAGERTSLTSALPFTKFGATVHRSGATASKSVAPREPAPRDGATRGPAGSSAGASGASGASGATLGTASGASAFDSVPGFDRCPNCFAPHQGAEPCRSCGFAPASAGSSFVFLKPGTLLADRYSIGRVLGQGGFGITYMGWDDRLQTTVAIKEYYPSMCATRSAQSASLIPNSDEYVETLHVGVDKFLEEARIIARIRSIPEIIGVMDFFKDNQTAYMIMEFLNGHTFSAYLKQNDGRISIQEALSLLWPVMTGLSAVHEKTIIHRDISPDNIYLTTDKRMKILDFGAARQFEGDIPMTVMLKRSYAPIEQHNINGHQGPWTDVYALSATIYRAIVGKPPLDAISRLDSDELPTPSQLGVKIPPGIEKALLKGLALRWQDRYATMKEMARSFREAIDRG